MASDGPLPLEPSRDSVISHPSGQDRSSRGIHRGASAGLRSPSLCPRRHKSTSAVAWSRSDLAPSVPGPVRAGRGGGSGAGRDRAGPGLPRTAADGMGWALLGVGLLMALYTLLRHGLRGAPRLRARPELRGRTAIVTGERRQRPPASRERPRGGLCPRSSPRSAPLRRGKQRHRRGRGAGARPVRGPRYPGDPQRPAGRGRRQPHPQGEHRHPRGTSAFPTHGTSPNPRAPPGHPWHPMSSSGTLPGHLHGTHAAQHPMGSSRDTPNDILGYDMGTLRTLPWHALSSPGMPMRHLQDSPGHPQDTTQDTQQDRTSLSIT